MCNVFLVTINSLLTLSRVIAALGSPSKSHINFRDSKLTRILQPALSGNARMAIICCATPSELYLEETRSTLQFASRAKLVKTRAQINEVLDDRSLIKKLQRELIEARRSAGGKEAIDQLRALEMEAADAKNNTKKAQEIIQHLKTSIRTGEILPMNKKRPSSVQRSSCLSPSILVYNSKKNLFFLSPASKKLSDERKKRRRSDGELPLFIREFNNLPNTRSNNIDDSFKSPMSKANTRPFSTTHKLINRKIDNYRSSTHVFESAENSLLKEALTAKGDFIQSIQSQIDESEKTSMDERTLLLEAATQIETLEDCKKRLETLTYTLTEEKVSLENKCRDLKSDHDNLSNEKEDALNVIFKENKEILMNNEKLNTLISTLQDDNKHLKEKNIEYEKQNNVIVSDVAELKSECDRNNKTIIDLTTEKDAAIEMNDKLSETKDAKVEEIDKLVIDNNTLETKVTNTELLLLAKEEELDEKELELNQSSQYGSEKDSGLKIAEVRIKSLEDDLSNIESIKIEIEDKNNEVNEELRQELENLGNERGELQNKLESTDGIIRDLRVEVDGLNIVVDEKSQQYNIELQKSADSFSQLKSVQMELNKRMNEVSTNQPGVEKEQLQIAELQQLLASATEREKSAESIALAADEELEVKELELEKLSNYLSNRDADVRRLEEQIKCLDDQLNCTVNNECDEELMKDMELLMDEKLQAEARLKEEITKNESSIKDLEMVMSDEQRILVQEAEVRMKHVREQLAKTSEKLKESINEANLLREELKENKDASKAVRSKVTETGASLISLKDKLNVSNGKILHLQDTIKDLQIESQNFKTHVSDAKEAYKLASQEKYLSAKEELKTMKEYLHDAEINIKSKSQELDYFKEKTKAIEKNAASAKDALITEKEMAVSKMKENLACIKTSLSRAEADTLFFKQEKDKYKDQLKILKNHSNSAKQGFNVEIEKNVDILQHKVDIFEENACKAIVEKEEYQNCIKVFQEKILILESKIIDLSNEKKIQETRIKRLEAKRLTKEQLAIIKTIKVSNSLL